MATPPETSKSLVPLPIPTNDLDEGKRNLDQFGYTIHEDLLFTQQLELIRARLLEKAELECEEGVATYRIANKSMLGDRMLGHPPLIQLLRGKPSLRSRTRDENSLIL
jgi:hypothetical protein